MITGSDGVSLRLPQLFFSQHRLSHTNTHSTVHSWVSVHRIYNDTNSCPPPVWLRSNVTSVFMSLPGSLREHISAWTACPNHQIFCRRDSILLRWRCNLSCTSGFVDDVVFSITGPVAAWRYHGSSLAAVCVRSNTPAVRLCTVLETVGAKTRRAPRAGAPAAV